MPIVHTGDAGVDRSKSASSRSLLSGGSRQTRNANTNMSNMWGKLKQEEDGHVYRAQSRGLPRRWLEKAGPCYMVAFVILHEGLV